MKYTFYIRAVVGQTTTYFGPYYLDKGCTATAITASDISNSGSFSSTASSRNIGAGTSNFYYFYGPTNTRSAYCSVISNQAVEADGSTDSSKVTESGSANWFNLVNTQVTAETFTFKILSTFTGGTVTHVSPQISMTLSCGGSYAIS